MDLYLDIQAKISKQRFSFTLSILKSHSFLIEQIITLYLFTNNGHRRGTIELTTTKRINDAVYSKPYRYG